MARANPGFHSTTIGEVVVTALNDGQFEAATALITGLPAQTSEALLRDSFRVLPPRFTVSCFLLEFAGRRVLVDFGTGGLYGAVLGHAPTRLAALGVAPDSIDTVLLTHGHPDHVGGLVDAAGAAVFARAELVVNATEAAFWTGEPRADNGDPARRALSAYAARLRHAADGEAVLPGITLHQFAGHTPGHSGYRIELAGQSLLIWADIVHVPGIQFARPEAGVAFDVDGEQARATRARVMDMVATDRLLVAGMHLDFPTFGHVLRRGDGYAFEPAVWAPTASGLFG